MAQLGARLNGIQKVRGSSPLSSTNGMTASPRRNKRRGLDAFQIGTPACNRLQPIAETVFLGEELTGQPLPCIMRLAQDART